MTKEKDGLIEQVKATLTSVLQRRRFGYVVEPVESNVLSIKTPTDTFRLYVSSSYGRIVDIDVRPIRPDGSQEWKSFYRLHFRRSKIPNLRKVGVTLANKIKCKPIHDTIKE